MHSFNAILNSLVSLCPHQINFPKLSKAKDTPRCSMGSSLLHQAHTINPGIVVSTSGPSPHPANSPHVFRISKLFEHSFLKLPDANRMWTQPRHRKSSSLHSVHFSPKSSRNKRGQLLAFPRPESENNLLYIIKTSGRGHA